MNSFEQFGWGILGAVIVEFLKWYNMRESSNFPEYSTKPRYWLLTVTMIIISGLVVVFNDIEKIKALTAVQLGGTTPMFLQQLFKTTGSNEEKTKQTIGNSKMKAKSNRTKNHKNNKILLFLSGR